MFFYRSIHPAEYNQYLARNEELPFPQAHGYWATCDINALPFVKAVLLAKAACDTQYTAWSFGGTDIDARKEFLNLDELAAFSQIRGVGIPVRDHPFLTHEINNESYWYKPEVKEWMAAQVQNRKSASTERRYFNTVGELRKAIDGVPDERLLVCQVVGKESGAWNLVGAFSPIVRNGTIAVLSLSHPDLKRLDMADPDNPNTGWEKS